MLFWNVNINHPENQYGPFPETQQNRLEGPLSIDICDLSNLSHDTGWLVASSCYFQFCQGSDWKQRFSAWDSLRWVGVLIQDGVWTCQHIGAGKGCEPTCSREVNTLEAGVITRDSPKAGIYRSQGPKFQT